MNQNNPNTQNVFDSFDPFNLNSIKKEEDEPNIHIRIFQRTSRKYITIIEDLDIIDTQIDLNKIVKYMKKTFFCNGSIKKTKDGKTIINLKGDQRDNIKKILLDKKIVKESQIKIHGF